MASEFGDARGAHPGSNLQTFYASQRHQTSRGSNEAEQMMQAKRRMAAQRERELRNYHQEQQYNRTTHAEIPYGGAKPDRTLSPGGPAPDDDRRKLIAQQRGALYGEGQFPEGGYADETGAPRPGGFAGQGTLRGHSPLAYEYGRGGPPPGIHPDLSSAEGLHHHPQGSQSASPHERRRANSNSNPQSNPPGGSKTGGGMFDGPGGSGAASRTSASSPGGSPPRQGAPGSGKPGQGGPVAPIGTRPSVSGGSSSLGKRETTPLPSPLSQGYTASGGGSEEGGVQQQQHQQQGNSGSAAEGASVGGAGLSGWGARTNNGWGNKSGMGVQASVWG
ncbi:hypothetical protein BT67DRAFT_439879 [Trichocladium antarcticum]|uniref:Uncharacterized protein n=1 Tax=Trichocladium antarcticum TaxID=1450529 RepID=A0AAN6UPM4_9PEZI|nr:hypothetical protein BT67DRAFT_439879 [Trichocladium antarcticum]